MNREERWRDIPDYEDRYQVSDRGRVRSLNYHREKRVQSLHTYCPPSVTYPFVCLLDGAGEAARLRVHELVLRAFVGERPPKQECRHLNGDPTDNRLANLAWGTVTENRADAIRHGTQPRGETHGSAKLTAAQVREIRRRKDESSYMLAPEFGVTFGTICEIRRGKTWRHI